MARGHERVTSPQESIQQKLVRHFGRIVLGETPHGTLSQSGFFGLSASEHVASLEGREEDMRENALVNIIGESIRLNKNLRTNEFGDTTRLVFESQGAIRFSDGSYVQFGADIRRDNQIFEIVQAPKGVQHIRTGNIRSCGVAEIPAGDHTMLLHGFDAQNLAALLEHGVTILDRAGTPVEQIQEIRLHTQSHGDYKSRLEQYCAQTPRLHPQVTYVDRAVPIEKQTPGTVVI